MEMPAYLELQNKDFIVNHVTVILLLNLILSTLIVLFLIKQNLVLDKAQEYRSQKSIAKSCLVSSMTVSRVINQAASDVGQSSFDALLEHLMMDEFKSVKMLSEK